MKHIFFLCLLAIIPWSCTGGGNAGEEEQTAADTMVAEMDKEKVNPAEYRRRNRMPFDKTLKQGPVAFHLSSPNTPEENTLVVAPSGLEVRNDTFQIGVKGRITEAQLADLDKDGFPEVYAFARSTEPDSTAYVYPFSSFKNRSYGIVSVTELSARPEMAEGHNGHGAFYFEDDALKRSFPIYDEGQPTGRQRVITYELRQGEASFVLEPVSSEVVE